MLVPKLEAAATAAGGVSNCGDTIGGTSSGGASGLSIGGSDVRATSPSSLGASSGTIAGLMSGVLTVKTEPRVHSPGSPVAVLDQPTTSGNSSSSNNNFPPSKRSRHEDWLPSPSQTSLDQLSPSSVLNGHPSYNVMSNGYSPMSSGSYDPYSPNGTVGEYSFGT